MPEREPQRAMTAHAVSRDRPSAPRAYRSVKGVHTAHQLRAHISFYRLLGSTGLSQYQLEAPSGQTMIVPYAVAVRGSSGLVLRSQLS